MTSVAEDKDVTKCICGWSNPDLRNLLLNGYPCQMRGVTPPPKWPILCRMGH